MNQGGFHSRKDRLAVLILGAILLSMFMGILAYGQEVTGGIVGVVTDATKAVIPNAAVTATGPLRSFKTTSGADGVYKFLDLQAGNYQITAEAQGFRKLSLSNVTVVLGKMIQVNLSMEVGTTAQTVEVTAADEPMLDVTSSKTSTNITEKTIELLPKGLNFSSVIQFAPGTLNESKQGGFQIDGASGSENVWVVDGIEVTRIMGGTLGSTKNIPIDWVKEVQVKSAGYEAEFGGATGGVVNVATKTGTNQFHGELRLDYRSDTFTGHDNPSLILNRFDNSKIEYYSNPQAGGKDKFANFYPVISIGGPILKDKLWFFTSYAPQLFRTTRKTDLIKPIAAGDTAVTVLNSRLASSTEKDDYYIARLDASPTSKLTLFGTFVNSPVKTNGSLLSYQVSSTDSFTDPRLGLKGGYTPAWQASFGATYSVTPKLLLSFRGGRNYLNDKGNSYDIPVGQIMPYIAYACLPPLTGCGAGTTTTGYPTIQNNFLTKYDITKRTNLNADATYVTTIFGQQHVIKGGYSANLLSDTIDAGYQGGMLNMYYNASYAGQRGTYGYYRITEYGTYGSASSSNQGLYIQDAWTAHRRLTLNLGIRFENEYLPSFPIDPKYHPSIPASILQAASPKPFSFGWGSKVAPRLGAAWDVFGTGKLVIKGSFSMFYDTMKYDMARGSFGADFYLRTWYTLNQGDFRGISLTNRPGNVIFGPVDYRVPSNVTMPGERPTVDPNLMPMREREYTVEGDYSLNPTLVISARFTRKQLDRTIEDIGGADAQGNEVFTIGNPGFGVSVANFNPPTPKAVRNYTGLEIRLDKRFSHNWYGNLSYVYSRLYGNYGGLASSDEFGRTNPSVERYFDLPELVYDTHGKQILGHLATDRPNTFKGFGAYVLNWKGMQTEIGGSQMIFQGSPLTTYLSEHVGSGGDYIYPEGRGDLGRTPTYTQTDLMVNHSIKLGERTKLKFGMTVSNLFDQRAVTDVYPYLLKSGFVQYTDMNDFLHSNGDWRTRITNQKLTTDPRFNQPRTWQGVRYARFSVGVTF